jgi:multiple sugar transport system permease protein
MNIKIRKISTVPWFVLALVLLLICITPAIWLVMISFQPVAVAQAGGLTFNFVPTLENYINVFVKMKFFKFVGNSAIIGLTSTLVTIMIASLAAYGFTRKKTKGTRNLADWVLSNKMFPPIATILPIYLMMSRIKLLDTYQGVIIVYIAANLPYAVWMLISFFEDIPIALDEASKIDGCSNIQTLMKIVMPLAGPGMLSTGIFIFVLTWSEFLVAVLLTSTDTKTLPVAIAMFITDRDIKWGSMAAAGTALVIPLAILFYSIQKYLIRGLTFGGIKE